MSERGEYCEHIENVLYHPCSILEDCSDITDEIVKVLNNNGYVIVRQKKIDEGHREIENQYNFIDYLQAYVEAQQKKIDELEAENQEMLEALIDAVQRFYDYEMSVDTDAPYEHRRAMKFYLKVIEKATGKTWEQIKVGNK